MKQQQPARKGHTAKHPAKQAAGKHNPHQGKAASTPMQKAPAAKKHAQAAKHAKAPAAQKRQLSPGSAVACCSAEALVTLLGLSGAAVSHEDVLALYWRTASHPDAGASLLDTLRAAGAGFRSFPGTGPAILGVTLPEPHAVAVGPDGTWWSWGKPFDPADWPDLAVDEAWEVTW